MVFVYRDELERIAANRRGVNGPFGKDQPVIRKLWDNFAEGCFNILSSARSAIDHRTFALECALDIAAQSVLLACVISMLAQGLGGV